MATAQTNPTTPPQRKPVDEKAPALPSLVLENGASMTAAEFHALYAAWPDETRFELIDGVVYMASPLHMPHAEGTSFLSVVLGYFSGATEGVRGGDGLSIRLDEMDEVQPDSCLFITQACGGHAKIVINDEGEETWLAGAPELACEVANSSRSIDYGRKLDAYLRAGVREYMVYNVRSKELSWFELPSRTLKSPDEQGVLRSSVMPGLWLAPAMIAENNTTAAIELLQAGLKSDEHAAFLKQLEQATQG